MRAVLPCVAFTIVSALALAPFSAAQDEEMVDDGLAYFLHAVGTECADGAFETFMDTEDTEGDLDGCGLIGGGFVDAVFEGSYPGKEPLGLEVVEGTAAEFHIFLTTQNPAEVSVTGSYSVGKKRCSGSSETISVTNTPVVNDWTEFAFSCVFEGKDEPNGTSSKKPGLTLTVTSDASIHYGYEGDHASNVLLTGLAQSLPPTDEVVEDGPAEESPGPGVLLAIVAAAATGLVAMRRRD